METYNPFLKVERVRRRGLGADVGRPEAGVALVLVGRDGKLTVLRPGDWLTLRGYLAGYAEVYTVDLGEHLLEWTAELPSHEDAFTFTATFALTCWITDPAAVVRQRIEDVGLLLWAEVERQARAVTRDFRLFDIGEAGQAIVKRLAGAVLHPAFGTRVSVTLSPPPLDQLSRQLGIRVPPAKRMLAHRGLSRVPVHVYARMDSELVVDQVASVQVIVSREAIRHVSQPTEVSGQAKADPERSIVVEVIGRTNLVAIIRNRQEVPIPAPNEPRLLLFDVRVTHSGEGELWVVARQGPLPLLTLVLRPRLRTEPSSAGPMSQAFASGEAVLGTPDTPLTVLRIHEERHGDAVIYRYDLDSPELGFTRAYASRLIKQDRDAYVRGLFQRIETAWIASGEDSAAFQEQLRAFGAELLDELVPMELQGDLWAHRDQVAHIVVLSTEPFIPWELVHLKDPAAGRLPDQTRFLAQLGLVRWLWQPQQSGRHSNIRLPQRLSLRPGQARYIIPDYPDPAWRLTALAAEQAFLERHLHAAPVTPHHADVLALLRQPDGFDLLHFAGHGRATSDQISDAELLLEGRIERSKYKPEPLPVAIVRQNFRTADDGPSPIVVLNACQTGRLGYQLAGIGGFAEAFVGGGAGAFISSLWSVGDSPARAFVEALYELLLADKPMAAAVRAARERARAAGDATWLAYTVYAHPEARVVRADRSDDDRWIDRGRLATDR